MPERPTSLSRHLHSQRETSLGARRSKKSISADTAWEWYTPPLHRGEYNRRGKTTCTTCTCTQIHCEDSQRPTYKYILACHIVPPRAGLRRAGESIWLENDSHLYFYEFNQRLRSKQGIQIKKQTSGGPTSSTFIWVEYQNLLWRPDTVSSCNH